MSILIKGFEMPCECRECPMEMFYINCGETRCRATNKLLAEDYKATPFDDRPEWCPLVEVPEPHGDLIDKDALIRSIPNEEAASKMAVHYAPTIIEAERSEV